MSEPEERLLADGHVTHHEVESPGDAQGVPVAGEQTAQGTSEQFPAVDGIRRHPRPEGESQAVFSEGDQEPD